MLQINVMNIKLTKGDGHIYAEIFEIGAFMFD